MKKTVFALWIAALMVLGYGLRNYNLVAREYATQMDAQSIEIYRYADNMQATYFVLLIAVFVVGVIVIGISTWHQSYREAHPRSSAHKNAEYWDKVGWLWLAGYFLALVAACVTMMTWSLPLGVLGLVPSAYLLYRGIACLALSDELKYPTLAMGTYSPREHPI